MDEPLQDHLHNDEVHLQSITELQILKEEDSNGFHQFWNYVELSLFLVITILAVIVILSSKTSILLHPIFLIIVVLFTFHNCIARLIVLNFSCIRYILLRCLCQKQKASQQFANKGMMTLIMKMSILSACASLSCYEMNHVQKINLTLALFMGLVLFVCLIIVIKNIVWFTCYHEQKQDKLLQINGQLYKVKDQHLEQLRKEIKQKKKDMLQGAHEVSLDQDLSFSEYCQGKYEKSELDDWIRRTDQQAYILQ